MPAEQNLSGPWDLVVIGAGYSGLNALQVATHYLKPGARVLVVDQRADIGGMWNDTYPYVRLHQPHRMFTAGNIPWRLRKDPAYLAKRHEIVDHLQDCWAWIKARLDPVEGFGLTYRGHDEATDGSDAPVSIRLARSPDASDEITVRARRCIKAFGFDVPRGRPLTLSSSRVHSISPESPVFLGEAMDADASPIYVVGGGKTGTDTALQLVQRYPQRRIEMFIGSGTAFLDRSRLFAEGPRRFWGGFTFTDMARSTALVFDGTNAAEAFEHFKSNFAITLDGHASRCGLGCLSPWEVEAIEDGVARIHHDYADDVVDDDDDDAGCMLRLRSGEQLPIEPGAWLVNCGGYLNREALPRQPCLSKGGAVMAIHQTSAPLFVASISAYFQTHLFLAGRLPESRLYLFDHQVTWRHPSYLAMSFSQFLYNLQVLFQELPVKHMLGCGLNFDNWYPLHRRASVAARLAFTREADINHCRAALDRACAAAGLQHYGPVRELAR